MQHPLAERFPMLSDHQEDVCGGQGCNRVAPWLGYVPCGCCITVCIPCKDGFVRMEERIFATHSNGYQLTCPLCKTAIYLMPSQRILWRRNKA